MDPLVHQSVDHSLLPIEDYFLLISRYVSPEKQIKKIIFTSYVIVTSMGGVFTNVSLSTKINPANIKFIHRK